MLQFLIHRPIAVTFSFLGLIILGSLSTIALPISLIPSMGLAEITVQVNYPDQGAQELEQSVIVTLRSQLMQVDNLTGLQSRTREGSAVINLSFGYKTDSDIAFLDVNERIDQAMAFLPQNINRPRVLKTNSSDIPMLYLSITPKNIHGDIDIDFSEFVRSTLQRRIEQLETVAFADLSGYIEPEIQIVPRLSTMNSLGIDIDALGTILRTNNVDIGNFLVQDGQYQYNVRMLSEVRTLEDIKTIYFHHRGTVLRLSDIADVHLAAEQRYGSYLYNDQPGVLFTIRKKADARLLDLRSEVVAAVKDFEESYPQIDCHMTYDQSAILRVSIDSLGSALLYGGLFAIGIMILFYREWRAPLLIALTIPVTLIIALLGFATFGISINVISLAGLILGVGLIIDNAIIVIDNIRQRLHSAVTLADACVDGTNEVIRPLISSMLTTCAVFIPLMFLSGLAGALFFDQAISIVCALTASIAVTYFLLPVLFRLLHTRYSTSILEDEGEKSLFERSVDGIIRFRWPFLLIIILLASFTITQISALDRNVFPALTRDGIDITLDWGTSITVVEAEDRVRSLVNGLRSDSLLKASNAMIGNQDFVLEQEVLSKEEAQILLFGSDIQALEDRSRSWISNYPNASIEIKPLPNIFDIVFSQNKAPIICHLQSFQNDQLIKPHDLKYLYDYLSNQGINISEQPMSSHIDISIRDDILAIYDIPKSTVETSLLALFNRQQAGILRTSFRQIPIRITALELNAIAALSKTFVQSRLGGDYPLSALVSTTINNDYKVITADEGGLTVDLILPEFDANLLTGISTLVRDFGKHTVRFSGQYYEDERIVKNLSYVLLVVLLLLYFILSAQFESLKLPFIIILDVPISLIGAFWALYWMDGSLNLVSLVGFIIASGIIVNDSILKIDMMEKAKKTGRCTIESIHEGGRRRLRPIIMTSLTTILAMLPILFGEGLGAELQLPLALTIIGGLIFGTIMSLYFVPTVYFLMSKH